ncbi:MAG: class I SAM-dependent methyltransferase [Planctomycetota bacterium]
MTLSPEQADANRKAVRAAGDRTLDQYQEWMLTNAASHVMRAARQLGVVACLRERQHTLEDLGSKLSINQEKLLSLMDALVAIGFVEQYEHDYALARAGHLLCQDDEDLGDGRWARLSDRLRGGDAATEAYQHRLAATQWIHTSAAMQAAEILDIGGASEPRGLRILDLGCGSAVWSCAMAHRDADSTVVAIDTAKALSRARQMADSIGMGERFATIESAPEVATLASQSFDLVVIAQQLSCRDDDDAARLLERAYESLNVGGRLVAPDFYAGPSRPGLNEATAALALSLETDGRARTLPEVRQMFVAAGLSSVQFTFLAASREGLGMAVGTRPGKD